MNRIFTSISNFSTLQEENAVYIDKTALIYQMIKTDRAFFLSRPRRFGKSLLVSTLEAYFQGRKELFNGLAIEKLEQDWTQYPVLRFDMSGDRYTKIEDLQIRLNVQLSKYEKIYGKEDYALNPNSRLKSLIERAKAQTGQNVVVLVDEYDAPLLDIVVDDDNANQIRTMLRSFYSPLKESGEHLRFVFLTGITKFSQLSIFSELNHLKIISMRDDYATICGFTEEEIRNELHFEVESVAEKYGVDFETMMSMLKAQYDGYHFSRECPDIYNPYSLLNALQSKQLDNYWFASGTPTHLTEMLSKYTLRPEELEGFSADADDFDAPTETAPTPIPILYQGGYLTIKHYENGEYILGFPNEEVRNGFLKGLMPYYSHIESRENNTFIRQLTKSIKQADINQAMLLLKSFFSSIPYDTERQNEAHYKTMFYLIFRLSSPFVVRTEERSAAGRCDALIETVDAIYVFEFKLHGTAKNALKQIDDKGYLIPYAAGDKKLYKIGVSFDEELRTIKEWLIEKGE